MSATKTLKLMKEKEVDYVDLRFTDPRGKLQHLTMDGKIVDDKAKYTDWSQIGRASCRERV